MNRMLIRVIVYPIILIFMVFMLNPSCAMKEVKGMQPAFVPYVEEFEGVYGKKVKFNIGFEVLEDEVVGICNHATRTIYIDKGYWNYTSEEKRLILIYHELGHCELRRRHTKAKFKDGCPTSIMYPEVLSDECLSKYKDYYLMEIFL